MSRFGITVCLAALLFSTACHNDRPVSMTGDSTPTTREAEVTTETTTYTTRVTVTDTTTTTNTSTSSAPATKKLQPAATVTLGWEASCSGQEVNGSFYEENLLNDDKAYLNPGGLPGIGFKGIPSYEVAGVIVTFGDPYNPFGGNVLLYRGALLTKEDIGFNSGQSLAFLISPHVWPEKIILCSSTPK